MLLPEDMIFSIYCIYLLQYFPLFLFSGYVHTVMLRSLLNFFMTFDNLLRLCTLVDVSLILLAVYELAGAFLLDCTVDIFSIQHLDFDILNLKKMK